MSSTGWKYGCTPESPRHIRLEHAVNTYKDGRRVQRESLKNAKLSDFDSKNEIIIAQRLAQSLSLQFKFLPRISPREMAFNAKRP